jgi:hypothetical protein
MATAVVILSVVLLILWGTVSNHPQLRQHPARWLRRTPLVKWVQALCAAQRKKSRRLDLEILWPACLKGARENYQQDQDKALAHAKAAFFLHVAMDPAWTQDADKLTLMRFVDSLEEQVTDYEPL